jgi:hypothetical protein
MFFVKLLLQTSFVLNEWKYSQKGSYHKQVDGSKIVSNISHFTTTLKDDEMINNNTSKIAKYIGIVQ